MADKNELEDDLRHENDFSQLRQRGERGKYAERFRTGTNLVRLEADVAAVFRTDEAVNRALRSLIEIARQEIPKAS